MRGSRFNCIVRLPDTYPDVLGSEPRPDRIASGPGKLEHRPRPTGVQLRDAGGFVAADLSAEPEEVAAVVWGEGMQSMKTIELESTRVPLFVNFPGRPGLVAGRVTLDETIDLPSPDHPGLLIEPPPLPVGRPLPALGGEGWYIVVRSRP